MFNPRRTIFFPSVIAVRRLARLTTLLIVAAAATLSVSPGTTTIAAENGGVPNIVLILADDK